jgi:stalled ribosome rescue protein Dom34
VLTSVLNICFTCRNVDVATRQKYVNLVESVKEYGGTVHIFSSLHVSGDRECTTMLL